MLFVGQRVTGGGILQAHDGDDVAGGAEVHVNALVGVHLQHAADALLLVLRGVGHVGTGLQTAGVDAQVGQLADERVGHDFECQGSERGLGVGRTLVLLARLRVGALDRRDVDRGRQVVDHGIQQLLNTLVLVGGAHQNRVQLAGQNALADGGLQLLGGDFLLHEDLLHQVVVEVGGGLQQLGAALLCAGLELIGDGIHRLRVGHALLVGLEVPRGHGDQVHQAPEVVLRAHGQLDGNGGRAQTVLHGVDRVEEVGTHAVVLVDEGDARHVVAVRLTPDRLGLGLHAGNGVEHGNGAVEHAQGALDLGREVHVARGVDDLHAVGLVVLGPIAGGGSGRDGYAALLLLGHPVHSGSAVMDLADLVGLTRVVQDALGGGRLTGIDVSHDAEVTGEAQVCFLSH